MRRRLSPLVVAIVLALVMTATSLGLAILLQQERAEDEARERALAAAREFATALTTYDYETLDEDFDAVLDRSANPFKEQYADTTEDLRDLFTEYQARSTSELVAAGVSAATTDSATVVLFVDQTVRNTNSAQPRVDRNRLVVELDRVDGEWLATEVTVT